MPHTLSRRAFLRASAAATSISLVGVGPALGAAGGFETPLAIPPLETGRLEGGMRIFNLTMQNGTHEFFKGYHTPTKGINASYLAPVLRLNKGEMTHFNVTNALGHDTTLHWHGFNLPGVADGGPHQVIRDGATWQPSFRILEEAATMWFHAHEMHETAPQVWAGLAGMAIIDDADGPTGLPREYGVDDIPLVLQDRRFQLNGTMPYSPSMHDRMAGMHGNYPVINGTIAPYLEVTREAVRLRLLNGSNASIYNLAFSDKRAFQVIGSDGGLLNAPVEMQMLTLAPGERAEIVVRVTAGEPVVLHSLAAQGGRRGGMMGGGMMRGAMMGGMGVQSPEFAMLQLRPAARLDPAPALPARLASLPVPDAGAATNTRQFLLEMGMGPAMRMGGGFTINGKAMDMARIDHVIKQGETEIWEIGNPGPMAHPFHVHNTQFRILSRNGQPPAAHEAGRKDTVLVQPGERVQILIRFDHYADPEAPYMFHCHILEHEDAGMMGQFTVV
ncbi:MAG TPA: oxidase [Aliiroseovarius sp.]|nr:oxidase [Aliiroseovarius sp.]